MLKKYLFDIVIWAMIVLWCGFIFSLSAENDEQSGSRSEEVCRAVAEVVISGYEEQTAAQQQETVDGMQFFVRKTAHFTAYLVLGALFCTAFRKISVNKRIPIALALSALYAATDEFHQSFVSGRDGNITDVLLDSCGALTGILICSAVIAAVYSKLRTEAPEK